MTIRPLLTTLAAMTLVLSGCSRFGVSQPRALIYQNTVTPLTMKRPAFGSPGVEIPANLEEARLHAHQVELDSPIPTLGLFWMKALSVGWGDIGTERTLQVGGFDEVVYADAHIFSILGVYTRSTVIAWGVPTDVDSSAETE